MLKRTSFRLAVASATMLALSLPALGAMAMDAPDSEKNRGQEIAASHRANHGANDEDSAGSTTTATTTETEPSARGHKPEDEQDDHHGGWSIDLSDGCVLARLAGKSGRGQIIGNGVHLVVGSSTEDDLTEATLTELAEAVATLACVATMPTASATSITTISGGHSDEALGKIVEAVEKVQGIEVLHANANERDSSEDEETAKTETKS